MGRKPIPPISHGNWTVGDVVACLLAPFATGARAYGAGMDTSARLGLVILALCFSVCTPIMLWHDIIRIKNDCANMRVREQHRATTQMRSDHEAVPPEGIRYLPGEEAAP